MPWARVHCGDLGSLVLGCEAKEGRVAATVRSTPMTRVPVSAAVVLCV